MGQGHVRYEIDDQQIAWLAFDRQGADVNTLNAEVMADLSDALDALAECDVRGLVIYSAKTKGFIAGADVNAFGAIDNEIRAFELIRQGQQLFDRIESLPYPTVAMIHGFCLGGGLELALACRYRVADEGEDTRLGLPEVKLGIHPGWGGTVRLPALIGPAQAMAVMLTGRTYRAKQAKRLGLLDACVPDRQLRVAAQHYALQPHQKRRPALSHQLTALPWVRRAYAYFFRKQLTRKVRKTHYPAPYAIVRRWLLDGARGERAFENEARSVARLLLSQTSRQLQRVFKLQERLKGLGKVDGPPIEHVHIIGAGVMGGDIAAYCALQGVSVTLQDAHRPAIAAALKRATQLFHKKIKQPHARQAAYDRLQPDPQGYGVAQADLVIEAIVEDVAAKKALFEALAPQLKSTAYLATNTSSIPLDEIAAVLPDPGRLIGLHFFNPVAKMPLVELIAGEHSHPAALAQGRRLIGQIGRLTLPVKSHPGFLVNRILMPYLLEAVVLFEEGLSPASIDHMARQFGMPMGPMALADQVGLDVCLLVARHLSHYFEVTIPNRLVQWVDKGMLGVKTGQGFYTYEGGKVKGDALTEPASLDQKDRLILRLVNEAVACVSEGLVEDEDLLDAGMIFGTGFAPFRGGVLQYARERGYAAIHARLTALADEYGPRFQPVPSALWSLSSEASVEKVADSS